MSPALAGVDSSVPPGKIPAFFSVLSRTSSTVLNSSGESGDLALFLTLGVWFMMLAVGFWISSVVSI